MKMKKSESEKKYKRTREKKKQVKVDKYQVKTKEKLKIEIGIQTSSRIEGLDPPRELFHIKCHAFFTHMRIQHFFESHAYIQI